MSMTGSLMGYENNNDVSQTKCKKPLKPLPVVSNSNASNISGTTKSKKIRGGGRGRGADCGGGREECSSNTKESSCIRGHVNSLWSIWYGILAVAFQAYIAMRYAKRFAAYLSLPWPADAPPPKLELYGCLVLAGTGVVLLPALLGAAFLKLGNLANDGMKLGRHLSACSRDTPSLLTNNSDNGLANNLWRHGGPTAAFVHLCTAMCFLLPSLLMEARLIHAGFLPKEAIWRTDLDWVMIHRDRLVLLSFMHPSGNLSTLGNFITPQPFVTISPDEGGKTDNLITTGSTTLRAVATISNQTGVESPRTENSPISKEKKFSITFQPATTVPFPTRTKSNQRGTPTESVKMLNTVAVTKTTMITTTTMISTPTKASVTSGTATNSNEADGSVGTSAKNSTSTPSNNAGRQRFKGKNSSKMAGASSSTKSSNFFQGTTVPQSMPLIMNNFADLDHPENLNLEIQPVHDPATDTYGPATLEYINYAAALGVYSVRYPAVFWSCNKALGTIFSIQLVMNSAQSLLSYAGMSVLYKVQVVGPLKVLPLLRHQRVAPPSSTISSIFGDSFFLLNPHVTLALFALSSLLVLCSSMVMYFYAHGRFTAFLNQERERRVILPKESREGSGWVYFTHCTALCVFLAIAICSAPLLYDYTVVYRGSLDGVILACIVGTIFHLLFWLALWVFLTVKQRWTFKLRVTIGRATVRSARSVKLVTDVDLLSAKDDDEDGTNAPLLVVGNGRTYTIADVSPKKAIMSVIQKAAMERRSRSQGGNGDLADGDSAVDSDEQIYWLRPKLRHSPDQPPNEAAGAPASDVAGKGWLNKRLKPKVTFNDLPSTSGARNKGKARRGVADGGADDDGDYATLRELPLMTSLDPADDSTSEENKISTGQTPRCLRRTDSGVPHEELTPRSDSSKSPPLDGSGNGSGGSSSAGTTVVTDIRNPVAINGCVPGSNAVPSNASSNSETSSSGVHSNASNVSNASHGSSQRRATSVDDLTVCVADDPNDDLEHRREDTKDQQWRSCSLQRGTQPPRVSTIFSPPTTRPGPSQSFATPQYANHLPLYNMPPPGSTDVPAPGCPAIILENPSETTVVIRRKLSRTKVSEPLNPNEEPFGRSTNMRMTSFTECNDLRVQASSATLPHYPTQPIVTYPHCSTMPLPHSTSHNTPTSSTNVSVGINIGGAGTAGPTGSGSCGSVTKHSSNFVPSSPAVTTTSMPGHTTLPSHHNGVRLLHQPLPAAANNPFMKRFPAVQFHSQPWTLPGHHTFPQAPPPLYGKFLPLGPQIRTSDRDSANFSMASSGDSDTCLPH